MLRLATLLKGGGAVVVNHRITPIGLSGGDTDPALLKYRSLEGKHLNHSPTQHDLHVGRTFALQDIYILSMSE